MKKGDIISKTVEGEVFEALVNWVVESEMGITYMKPETYKGGSTLIDLGEDKEWKVIQESAPSYQSTVASMSEDELRESIGKLRKGRTHLPKVKTKVRGVRAKDDPITKAFKNLPPEKREALMKRLGMVD